MFGTHLAFGMCGVELRILHPRKFTFCQFVLYHLRHSAYCTALAIGLRGVANPLGASLILKVLHVAFVVRSLLSLAINVLCSKGVINPEKLSNTGFLHVALRELL